MYCILCRFAGHELDTDVVYEDDKVFAYKDWNHWGDIHVILFPKHHVGLEDKGTPAYDEAVQAVEEAIPVVAEKAGMKTVQQIVRCDVEPHITQNLHHFHYHILGTAIPHAPPLGEKELGSLFLLSFSHPEQGKPDAAGKAASS